VRVERRGRRKPEPKGDASGAGQAEPCERGGEPVDREDHTQTRCYPHRGPNLEETPEEEGGVEAPGDHDPHVGTGNRTDDVDERGCTWASERATVSRARERRDRKGSEDG
jgi:hypothetical protein